jgi:hypothetical protein
MNMAKYVGVVLLLIGSASVALATPVPEIDPGSGMSALALLSGALLVIRARRNK